MVGFPFAVSFELVLQTVRAKTRLAILRKSDVRKVGAPTISVKITTHLRATI